MILLVNILYKCAAFWYRISINIISICLRNKLRRNFQKTTTAIANIQQGLGVI